MMHPVTLRVVDAAARRVLLTDADGATAHLVLDCVTSLDVDGDDDDLLPAVPMTTADEMRYLFAEADHLTVMHVGDEPLTSVIDVHLATDSGGAYHAVGRIHLRSADNRFQVWDASTLEAQLDRTVFTIRTVIDLRDGSVRTDAADMEGFFDAVPDLRVEARDGSAQGVVNAMLQCPHSTRAFAVAGVVGAWD
jgi:hypothetical protein